MTGAQLRAARALLGWSAQTLASTSGVGITTIRKNEVPDGPVTMIRANVEVLTRTLETAGVEFISENGGGPGVRLRTRLTPA
jgi:transcriptional regulator with XRE-family HTH domain